MSRKRFETVMEAIRKGERDAQLLDGREFDLRYWQNARRQLNVLRRELELAESRNEALAAVIEVSDGR